MGVLMKKFHICFYITLFFISACSDFKGNEDDVEASLSSTPSSNSNTTNTSYKNLYGVAFGNNTFIAVGQNGVMRSSSDNGSTWDNVTSGTTRHLYETAFGNNTFISVGQRGTIRQSQDNGSTWNSGNGVKVLI